LCRIFWLERAAVQYAELMKIRIWQLDVDSAEPAGQRMLRVQEKLAELASDTDVLVLPELWLPGAFALQELAAAEMALSDEFFIAAQRIANSTGTTLHLGSFPIRNESGTLGNTSVVLRANQPATTYRKQHLFGFADGERKYLEASNDLVVVPTQLGQTGLVTCYDLRFPELFRDLLDDGADCFIIPAGWPAARIHHWTVLLQARAIENQAIVIGANSVGLSAGVELGGRSAVIAADGEILAQAADDECVLEVEVDIARRETLRKNFPVLADRRKK
jgi:predicted amidohydrolase